YQAALRLNERWAQEPLSNLASFPSDLGRHFNNPLQIRADLANDYWSIGSAYYRAGRTSESLVAYQRAAETYEALILEHSRDPKFRGSLAAVLRLIGFGHGIEGRQQESLRAYQRALEIVETLVTENPAVAAFQSQLAVTHRDMGRWMRRNHRLAEGQKHLE